MPLDPLVVPDDEPPEPLVVPLVVPVPELPPTGAPHEPDLHVPVPWQTELPEHVSVTLPFAPNPTLQLTLDESAATPLRLAFVPDTEPERRVPSLHEAVALHPFCAKVQLFGLHEPERE